MEVVQSKSRAPAAPQPVPARRRARSWRRVIGLAVLVIVAAIGCAVACASMSDLKPILLIPPVTGVIGLTAMRYRGQVDDSVARLRDRLAKVRLGVEPIEALQDDIRSSAQLALLADDIAKVLRELRHEKKKASELHEEMRQRVASRTDALQRVIGSLRQQASRDALTGLYNRRMMDRYLREIVDRCRASGLDLALLMIDIDDFKPLNDTLGHPAGDELLKNVGLIIRSSIREQDAAFRYGGDEFAIVLPGAEAEGASALAARLRSLTAGLTKG